MPTRGKYLQVATLKGHRGAIACLSATEDGRLATRGYGGVTIWNIQDKTRLKVPTASRQRGATTALIWVRRDDELEHGLFYGTQAGFLIGWKETCNKDTTIVFEEVFCAQMAHPSEVTSLAFDAAMNYLAACNRDGVVQLYAVNSMMALKNIFSIAIREDIRRMI